MTSNLPRVLAIGSCRIFRPLRRLHDAGYIQLVNYEDRFWFTHTAAAARQYVDVMQGLTSIPAALRPAALETDLEWPDDMALGLPVVDVAVVEVSSLKESSIGKYKLNAHKIYGIANATGLNYRPIVQGITDSLSADHVLKPLKVAYTTGADLRDDLGAIRKQINSPVLLVDHLYSLTPDGSPAPERVKLTETLREAGRVLKMPLYETRTAILKHGIDVALLDQNHYRSEFEMTAGLSILPKVKMLSA